MPSTHDPIEALAEADPAPGAERLTADEQLEAEALLARITAEPVAAPRQRLRVRRWAPAVAIAGALALVLAVASVVDDDAPGPSIVDKAIAAVSAENAVYHVVELTRAVDISGGREHPFPYPVYIESWHGSNGAMHQKMFRARNGHRGELISEMAGRMYPRTRGRFGGPAVAYDPEENTIRHMRFGRFPVRTPVINSNTDPGADLRELERHGRLRVAGTTQVDGREAYRLVSGPVPGTPKGSVDRLEYVVDAETYYPVSLRWRHHFRRHVIEINTRFLVYERLPLDARGRELLRLDSHPGAVELDRMGRRVRD
jgi:hypothetical protein